ncbi:MULTISPECIES: HPr-rel-A system PqqD family peptide chaperone [Halorhodospira]|uniref:HPr-rel-A system PqqD family peptide chaperone n=1 Tax=Halorhodospira TaxID=85108 RepID=UPI001913F537|nr:MULTISPECIES: HPr-rel-A system PqqD family peptide chaperone [Halorhodospira]MBK5936122.1 hypothetical protein [Halorhodospira halophila]MCG5537272.1 HPr-rel-A system PqqD family peptide chaperone [Halorhodospira sp. 9622]MCG5540164.1 HPr-rel-A system PqqD family peptide chaperone [Halorhodospira sp. M39old]
MLAGVELEMRDLGGEVVIFHAGSGQTHCLAGLVARLFRILAREERPRGTEALMATLRGVDDPPFADADALEALEWLRARGVIRGERGWK